MNEYRYVNQFDDAEDPANWPVSSGEHRRVGGTNILSPDEVDPFGDVLVCGEDLAA